MRFRLRQLDPECKLCQTVTVDLLGRVLPMETIRSALQDARLQTPRTRKLTLEVVVLLIILMNLYPHVSLGYVLEKLAHGCRLIWPGPEEPLPRASAITYRRYQLGVRPLVALFRRVCRPIATSNTSGAFLFGLRLMAIDGTVEDLPDTPENDAFFGRYHGDRGESAFPQVQAVYLCECGTHAIVDAGFWPCQTSERVGGFRMLRSVTAGMLVMWDQGFHDFRMFRDVHRRGAHVISRLPPLVKPQFLRSLADGSFPAWLQPADRKLRKQGGRLLVRIIPYTLTDPALPGYGEPHRLITTLLDPEEYPAVELVCAYHERWEFELAIDEMDTHQRLPNRPLRSRKPLGVLQELYGLVIAHYVIRYLMHEAALEAGVDPDQLSFVHAVRVIADPVPDFQIAAPEILPRLYARLLHEIAAGRLPERRYRSNPRVVKRKVSKFMLKRAHHYHWPKPTRPFRAAVALI
jgi:hypothetical protein